MRIPAKPGPRARVASRRGAVAPDWARSDPLSWMSQGACQREDPELFFPIAATGPALQQVNSAKAVCGRCPVRASCLSYALETGQDGVWGGTTREERTDMGPLARAKRP
jgi:WhiB family redox-sensing transcriptional regulator